MLIPELITIAAWGGTFRWLRKRVISSAWVFRVCDFFRIYEVLDFMFKAHAGVSRMTSNLVKFTVTVWVKVWSIQVRWFRDG